jgi:hypothetical protein
MMMMNIVYFFMFRSDLYVVLLWVSFTRLLALLLEVSQTLLKLRYENIISG